MPRHRQVTVCRHGGPVSKRCSCEHCSLAVCAVCGTYEGSLTTDCPGEKVSFDRQQEIYETPLDYTETRGWHLSTVERAPRFEIRSAPQIFPGVHSPRVDVAEARILGCSCGWRTPQGVSDSDDAFALHVAIGATDPQARLHRVMDLQYELSRKAVAWVFADRIADDRMAALDACETEAKAHVAHVSPAQPDARTCDLLGKIEEARAAFRLADANATKCDEEFRQAARRLVTELETK